MAFRFSHQLLGWCLIGLVWHQEVLGKKEIVGTQVRFMTNASPIFSNEELEELREVENGDISKETSFLQVNVSCEELETTALKENSEKEQKVHDYLIKVKQAFKKSGKMQHPKGERKPGIISYNDYTSASSKRIKAISSATESNCSWVVEKRKKVAEFIERLNAVSMCREEARAHANAERVC
eukprot:gnl/MRDRNA2_/MRDRNA2_57006_c0_seq1.p1 gnl/MRDRNA2_/MRDRNA2_57006_c0~~gnl/MRDRNA2_/MRDRNA2_57006_c0_seq1.p1  ORF type:complete len:182 (+),score=35.52 gnl/MRDRNA2_/MRDRNA2_57006_c0_seq1:79-624(+)